MELPDLGKHCSEPTCRQLDFLPLKCDACENIFCREHIAYETHNCSSAHKKNVQVPVCPLCNAPVPLKRGEQPDIVVGAHIDRDCQSDPAKNKRKVFSNKCSVKGCKNKEVVPVTCKECKLNFCLKHRLEADHNCEGQAGAARRRAAEAALARQHRPGGSSSGNSKAQANMVPRPSNPRVAAAAIQGSMSEDEALARALALSMEESNPPGAAAAAGRSHDQVTSDFLLAQALAASEQQRAPAARSSSQNKCEVS